MRLRRTDMDNDEIIYMQSTITTAIAAVTTNPYMKIVQLHLSRQRPIHLRMKSSVQIDRLLLREGDFLGLPSNPNSKKYQYINVILVNR